MLLLVATALLCQTSGVVIVGNDELSCRNSCEEMFGYTCLRECEFVLIDTPDDLVECRKKCYLERADCIADCKPWWRDWR